MTEKDVLIIVLLMLSLILFPAIAYYNQKSSLLLFSAVFVCAVIFHFQLDKETYDRMDFFPWNEANLVKKRDRDSTVIDCAWYLDQKKSDNLFKMSDPVVAEYDNLSS